MINYIKKWFSPKLKYNVSSKLIISYNGTTIEGTITKVSPNNNAIKFNDQWIPVNELRVIDVIYASTSDSGYNLNYLTKLIEGDIDTVLNEMPSDVDSEYKSNYVNTVLSEIQSKNNYMTNMLKTPQVLDMIDSEILASIKNEYISRGYGQKIYDHFMDKSLKYLENALDGHSPINDYEVGSFIMFKYGDDDNAYDIVSTEESKTPVYKKLAKDIELDKDDELDNNSDGINEFNKLHNTLYTDINRDSKLQSEFAD